MSLARAVAAALASLAPATAAHACPEGEGTLLLSSCDGPVRASLTLLPDGEGVPLPDLPGEGETLTVTGAYTSGERVEPEGFVLDRGAAFDPYPQGWDGLLVLAPDGAVSLHHVERVSLGDDIWNLRDRDERRAFLDHAETGELSAIQSHLLIVDGALDVRPRAGAPRFRRRLLFTTAEGGFGLWDSGAPLTLHEAAVALAAAHAPAMALNLDMGSYDFCERATAEGRETCGVLGREATAKLSNVLTFERAAAAD